MSTTVSHDDFLPQDAADDDSSLDSNTAQPLSESEIEDLLYGGDRSTAERLQLLRSLRDDMSAKESGDFGDNDPGAVVREIDDRIAELEGAEDQTAIGGQLDVDPLAHRETLAPDSDELEELEEEDDASLDEDDIEWAAENEDKDDDSGAAAAPPDEEEPKS